MTARPRSRWEPRVCLFCGREFEPKKGNQRCCDRKCRARLQHNVKLDDSLRILNVVSTGNKKHPDSYAFTVLIHGYAVKGFLYRERSGQIKWPSCFLSYGPFYKQQKFPGHGMGIPTARLQKLVREWLDAHDSDLERKRVDEEERQKAEAREREEDDRREWERNERYEMIVSRPISPCCHSICERPEYLTAICRACGVAYNLPDKRIKWTRIDKRQTPQEQQAAYDADMLERQRPS